MFHGVKMVKIVTNDGTGDVGCVPEKTQRTGAQRTSKRRRTSGVTITANDHNDERGFVGVPSARDTSARTASSPHSSHVPVGALKTDHEPQSVPAMATITPVDESGSSNDSNEMAQTSEVASLNVKSRSSPLKAGKQPQCKIKPSTSRKRNKKASKAKLSTPSNLEWWDGTAQFKAGHVLFAPDRGAMYGSVVFDIFEEADGAQSIGIHYFGYGRRERKYFNREPNPFKTVSSAQFNYLVERKGILVDVPPPSPTPLDTQSEKESKLLKVVKVPNQSSGKSTSIDSNKTVVPEIATKKSTNIKKESSTAPPTDGKVNQALKSNPAQLREKYGYQEPPSDARCCFCNACGDGQHGEGELLGPIGSKRLYTHNLCAIFAPQVVRGKHGRPEGVVKAHSKASVCEVCNEPGAVIACSAHTLTKKVQKCGRVVHYRCMISAGYIPYIHLGSFHCICPEHARSIAVSNQVRTKVKCGAGNCPDRHANIADLLYCVSCGTQFHASCVDPSGMLDVSIARDGWQCSHCKLCMVCKSADDEDKILVCSSCDRGCHTYCAGTTSIPKGEWKCSECTYCHHCGSRETYKWYMNYTMCATCYRRRSQGHICCGCNKVYKHADKDMIQCDTCDKWVHYVCDGIDEETYNAMSTSTRPYECPRCRKVRENNQAEYLAKIMEQVKSASTVTPCVINEKKAIKNSTRKSRKRKIQDRELLPPEGVSVTEMATLQLQQPAVAYDKELEDDSCGTPIFYFDEFTTESDICKLCGGIGVDEEGAMIFCVQCGEGYHPYCINENFRVSQKMLELGWRCMDCTVCEICKEQKDDHLVLLCDECGQARHTYCSKPPLEDIPFGPWKCDNCAECTDCGTRSAERWKNNHTSCYDCWDMRRKGQFCSVCQEIIKDHDSVEVIKCKNCGSPVHLLCEDLLPTVNRDILSNERKTFNCALCRHRNPALPRYGKSKSTGQSGNPAIDSSSDESLMCEDVAVVDEAPTLLDIVVDDVMWNIIDDLVLQCCVNARTFSWEGDEDIYNMLINQLFEMMIGLEMELLIDSIAVTDANNFDQPGQISLAICTVRFGVLLEGGLVAVIRMHDLFSIVRMLGSTDMQLCPNNCLRIIGPHNLTNPVFQYSWMLWYRSYCASHAFERIATERIASLHQESFHKTNVAVSTHTSNLCASAPSNSVPPSVLIERAKARTDAVLKLKLESEALKFVAPLKSTRVDERECGLCRKVGDGRPAVTGRLLNFDVNRWVHVNCARWCSESVETKDGTLEHVSKAIHRGKQMHCTLCHKRGATVGCANGKCKSNYHFPCAIKSGCVFLAENAETCGSGVIVCSSCDEAGLTSRICRKKSNRLERVRDFRSLSKFSIHRDVSKQRYSAQKGGAYVREGAETVLSAGEVEYGYDAFHTNDYIYPKNLKTRRMYWSMQHPNVRAWYECEIQQEGEKPVFSIVSHDVDGTAVTIRVASPEVAWTEVLQKIDEVRSSSLPKSALKRIESSDAEKFKNAMLLFGFSSTLTNWIEDLPGSSNCKNYKLHLFLRQSKPAEAFLAEGDGFGCARTRAFDRAELSRRKWLSRTSGETAKQMLELYKKKMYRTEQRMNPKRDRDQELDNVVSGDCTTQYRKLGEQSKIRTCVFKSMIEGWGLVARCRIPQGEMIIEYVGELVRKEISECREALYNSKGIGCYMFGIADSEYVIDATMRGNSARFINHGCEPNCESRLIVIQDEPKIIIYALRDIEQYEELVYDYKFELDEADKVRCRCGAKNCLGWMN